MTAAAKTFKPRDGEFNVSCRPLPKDGNEASGLLSKATHSVRKCTSLKGTFTGLAGEISPTAARQAAGRHHQEGFRQ